MEDVATTDRDRAWAHHCEICPTHSYACRDRDGIIRCIVANFEAGIYPFCKAREKVHDRRHLALSPQSDVKRALDRGALASFG